MVGGWGGHYFVGTCEGGWVVTELVGMVVGRCGVLDRLGALGVPLGLWLGYRGVVFRDLFH